LVPPSRATSAAATEEKKQTNNAYTTNPRLQFFVILVTAIYKNSSCSLAEEQPG